MKFNLLIISYNTWLEELLKQYFNDFIIKTHTEEEDLENFDIIIDQTGPKNLEIRMPNYTQFWSIAKPISINSLVNILEQAILTLSEKIIAIGNVKFYPEQKLCKFEEEIIELTQKEKEILLYLAKEYPNPVNKTTLLNEIWGYAEDISTHTLETHIYKLRNKFAGKSNLISLKDAGYILEL